MRSRENRTREPSGSRLREGHMAGRTEFSNGKFKELVLLFSARSEGDPLMGRVKLNKLLYRADFEAFRILGHSITGATYVRGEHGPMAAQLPLAEEELGRSGYLSWRHEEGGPHRQKVPVAKESPDESQFSVDEMRIIEKTLEELADLGGKGAREWSHKNSSGWNLVDDEEAIPYETAFVSMERPSDAVFQRAKQLARERNWAEVRP